MFGRRRRELEARVAEVPFWFHSIDLGRGVTTPGRKSRENLDHELASLCFPRLDGRTFLDVGAWDGYFSFAAEALGASRVVALDHYVWSLDLPAQVAYWEACRAQGELPAPYETRPELWDPVALPGKRGFDTARELLGSRAESMVADFMATAPEEIGAYDVVLFKGVLYHLEAPLEGLRRLAGLTRELAIVETAAVAIPGLPGAHLWESYPRDELNHDPSNWWAPTLPALRGLCEAAGFSRVEAVAGPPADDELEPGVPTRYRAIVHAYR